MANSALNRSPYFDDYDPQKNYHKILFKEGVPIQSRELTQLQTILQEQLNRFGKHFFKEGSIVSGCENKFNFNLSSIGLVNSIENHIVLSKFNRAYGITSSGVVVYILYAISTNNNLWKSEPVIIFSPVTGETLNTNDIVYLYDYSTKTTYNSTYLTVGSNTVSTASSITFQPGIIFFDGMFLSIEQQDIVIDPYSITPSVSVGYQIIDEIVTWKEDFTLLNNVTITETPLYNKTAPGADRLKKTAILKSIPLLTTQDYAEQSVVDNFIEFVRIINGEITKDINTTVYSEFEKNLARRTYDEAGNFTVRPFHIKIIDHIFKDPNLFSIEVSPGKGYIKGFEFETKGRVFVDLPKAITTETKETFAISTYFGSYIKLNTCKGFFDTSINEEIELFDQEIEDFTDFTDSDERLAHRIGTARVRFLQKVGTDFWIFIFKPTFISGSFDDVRSVAALTNNGRGNLKEYKIFDPNNDKVLFKFPERISNLYSYSFFMQKVFPDARFQQNPETGRFECYLALDGGYSFTTDKNTYLIFNNVTLESIPVYNASILTDSSSQVLIEVEADSNFNGYLFAIISKSFNADRVVKEVIKKFTFSDITVDSVHYLNNCVLGTQLISVTRPGGKTDISEFFTIDTNEDMYRYGVEKLRFLGKSTIEGELEVTVKTQEIVKEGFFSTNFWNSFNYNDIVFSDGSFQQRTDYLDFRPLETSSGVISSACCISPFHTFECSYSYYLGRIDKLACTPDKKFALISGIPSQNPATPKNREDWMTLYSLILPPGTRTPELVNPVFHENKRYTMRDISGLEQRIKNLEYYTALNLLEKDTASFAIVDEQGNNRFTQGFLVDNFKNYDSIDLKNPEIQCCFDIKEGYLRPTFTMTNLKAEFNESTSTLLKSKNGLVTLPYKETILVDQPLASFYINLQPYEVFLWVGSLTLSPSVDDWVDTTSTPPITTQQYEAKDVWAEIGAKAFRAQWKSWDTYCTALGTNTPLEGVEKVNFANISTQTEQRLWNPDVDNTVPSWWIFNYNNWVENDFVGWFDKTEPDGYVNGKPAILMPFKIATETTVSQGNQRAFTTSKIITNSLGENVTGYSMLPYMRSQIITFSAKALKPNTKLYAFFDTKDVTEFCNIGQGNGVLITSPTGTIQGTFTIPPGEFVVGARIFEMSDSPLNRDYEITTKCSAKYTARGITQNKQETFLSTREPQIVDTPISATSTKKIYAWGGAEPPPTPSTTPSASPTSSTSPSPSNSPSGSTSPSNTPTPSNTPSNSPSGSTSPSNTPTPSVTPSNTPTPSVTPSNTPTPSPSKSKPPATKLLVSVFEPYGGPGWNGELLVPDGNQIGQSSDCYYSSEISIWINAGGNMSLWRIPSPYTIIGTIPPTPTQPAGGEYTSPGPTFWPETPTTIEIPLGAQYAAQQDAGNTPPGEWLTNGGSYNCSQLVYLGQTDINSTSISFNVDFKLKDGAYGLYYWLDSNLTEEQMNQPDNVYEGSSFQIWVYYGFLKSMYTRMRTSSSLPNFTSYSEMISVFPKDNLTSLGNLQYDNTFDPATVIRTTPSQFLSSLHNKLLGTNITFNIPTYGHPSIIVTPVRNFLNNLKEQVDDSTRIKSFGPFTYPITNGVYNHLNVSFFVNSLRYEGTEIVTFIDPIAQTFEVNKDQYPSGVFITGADIYFKTKSKTVPVKVELRETVNGFPHSKQRLTQALLDPDDIQVSNDSRTPTRVTFDNPVYVLPGEFALCLIANTTEYTAYIATVGEYMLGSTVERVSKNPYLGTFFKSMNSSTWVPQPESDLKFSIFRAVFPTNTEINGYFQPILAGTNEEFTTLQINGSVITPDRTNCSKIVTSLKRIDETSDSITIDFNETQELDNIYYIPVIG